MINRLGYACICNDMAERTPSVFMGRTLRLSSFSIPKVSCLSLLNVQDLYRIIQWNVEHNITFFRIGSNLFPFIDHPSLCYAVEQLPDGAAIKEILLNCGNLARQYGMRLTSHPGPYNCLGSPNDDVVRKTVLSLEVHRMLGELLGLGDFVINIHIGGGYGDLDATGKRFCANFGMLSMQAQQWLTVENDDKASLWSVRDLYERIYSVIGIPIVFDMHHWRVCHALSMQEEACLALKTWGNKIPKMHYSESRGNDCLQAHSDYIENKIPDLSPTLYDVMIEAKQKERALLKYRLCQPVP